MEGGKCPKAGWATSSRWLGVEMAMYKLPSWRGATPGEVLGDIERVISTGGLALEALRMMQRVSVGKSLGKEINDLDEYIKAVVRKGYSKFEKLWPGWLTPERVAHFNKYLDI